MTKISRQGFSIHMSYPIKELSERLRVNVKTIRRWIESGLKTVPSSKKTILIHGADLKEFLKNKDAKKKVPLKRNEFYCFKCKVPRLAKRGSTQVLHERKTALCSVCGSKMVRIIKPYQKGLFDTLSPRLNVHYEEQKQTAEL